MRDSMRPQVHKNSTPPNTHFSMGFTYGLGPSGRGPGTSGMCVKGVVEEGEFGGRGDVRRGVEMFGWAPKSSATPPECSGTTKCSVQKRNVRDRLTRIYW